MAEWEQGGTIMRFAVSPIVGIAAGFVFKTQPDCGTTTTGEPLCQPTFNKDAAGFVTVAGWLVALLWEWLVCDNQEAGWWFMGSAVLLLIALAVT